MFITLWRTNVPPNLSRDWIMSSFWLDLCQLKCFTTCFTLTTMRLGCTLMPIIPYNLTARLEISDQNSTFLDPEMLNSNFESGARLPNGATSSLASAATVLSKKVRQNSLLWTPNRFGISFSSFCLLILFYIFPPRASDSRRTLCQGFLSLHHPPWECKAVLEPCSASAVHPGERSTETCAARSKVKFEDFYCIYYAHLSL